MASLFSRAVRLQPLAWQPGPAMGLLEHACWELSVKESRTGRGPAEESRTLLLRAEEDVSSSPDLELIGEPRAMKEVRTHLLRRDGIQVQVTTWAILCTVHCFKCFSVYGFLLL